MKVFVTGGGGFLGQVIVRQLIAAGYEVVTFSRGRYTYLDQPGIRQIQGSIADYDALKTAMQGCEAVFHTAALTGVKGRYRDFYEPNVTGTHNVLRACRELGIPHLVFTSSPSVAFEGNAEGRDESLPYARKFDAYYPQTKAIAEQVVLAANGPALVTCALRPHLVWGPHDPHFLPRLFDARRKNRLANIGRQDHWVDTIYVDNAAQAHLQAFEAMRRNPSAVGGKAYFLSQDQPVTIRDFIDRLLDTGSLPPVTKTMNPRLALFAGWLVQNLFRIFNPSGEPPVTTFVVRQLSCSHWYNISAAKRDFGYTPTISIDEGMKRVKEAIKSKT